MTAQAGALFQGMVAIPGRYYPCQQVPGQAAASGSGLDAGMIQVLDANQPASPLASGLQVTPEGGNDGTEMQGAAGHGRKAAPVTGSWHHCLIKPVAAQCLARNPAGMFRPAESGLLDDKTD